MSDKTLLQRARNHVSDLPGPGREYTREEQELALAWMLGDVSLGSVTAAKDLKHGSATYTFLALAARAAFRAGLVRPDSSFRLPTD